MGRRWTQHHGRWLRFGAGSVVAVACSQTTFLLVYGPLGASTTVASVLAWFAGAVPNYWLNRAWTWRRRGTPSVRRELLPYAGVVLGTLLLAMVVTALTERGIARVTTDDGVRTVAVTASYFAVYAVMFVLRFRALDRLFGSGVDDAPRPERQPVAGKE